nr:DUF2577 domain-containing protein [uncultured Cellulosilyticum sp.]
MMDNPYSGLLQMMQTQGAKNNPPSICLGEVITPNPLTIKTEDLILDHDDILVSDVLVDGYKRELVETGEGTTTITGTLSSSTQNRAGGSGDNSFASHNHEIYNQAELSGSYTREGTIQCEFKSYLKVGDLLAMMPTVNRQQYIVLCKVVSV